jgi:hypothetical protein
MGKERQWQVSDVDGGQVWQTRVRNEKIKIYMPDDWRQRKRVWRWDAKWKAWVEEINSARAVGLLSLPMKRPAGPRNTWAITAIVPFDDPRDARVDWQSIERANKNKTWHERKPENTKRSARVKRAAVRGQQGNSGSDGNI